MRRTVVISAACCAVMALAAAPRPAAASTPGDWSTFHGDAQHTGVSSDTTINATTASGLHVAWSQSLGGGPAISSPVVAFNTTLAENLLYEVTVGGVAAALNATTGAPVWSVSVGTGIVGTPAIDGNSVYFGDDQGALRALDATTGVQQCVFQLPIIKPQTTPGRIEDAPVVGHDATGAIVYFGDAGQEEKPNHGREWAVNGVGNTAGDCTQKWMTDLKPGSTSTGSWSPPAMVTDSTGRPVLVFGTSQPDDGVYELDARDGSVIWHFATLKNFSDADVGAGPTISAPGVNGMADGAVYIDGKDRIEYALDLLTGAQLWQFDLGKDAKKSPNSVSTAALIGNQVVVAFSKYVYSFNATTGAKLWRSPITSGTFLGSVIVSGASGNEVVLSADLSGKLYAHQLSSGAKLATVTLAQTKIDASVAISNGMAFICGENGIVYGLAVT